jgi:hypothetical protein
MTDQEDSLWALLNPLWLFHGRPQDFQGLGRSICPGIAWLPGICGLLTLHVTCFSVVFTAWIGDGYTTQSLAWLTPVAAVWLLFGSADIKFRLQGGTKDQRRAFDNAAINWFGFVTIILFYPVLLPLAVGYFIWTMFV